MRYLTFLAFFSILLFSCKPSAKEALRYSDTISSENNKISKKYNKLIDSYNDYVPAEMDKAYADVKEQIEQSLAVVGKLEDFGGDSTFKKGAISLFESYSSILNNEHKRIIELLKLPEDEYQTDEIKEYKRLIETSNSKLDSEIKKLHKIQKEFVKPYENISLVKEK